MIPASIKSRVEDLALMHGLPVDHLEAGVKEAVQVFNRFVEKLPAKLQTPEAFTKLMADNYELVYSLLESAGLALGNENTALRDEIAEMEMILGEAHKANIMMVAAIHRAHKTYAFQLDEGGVHDVASIEEHDDDGDDDEDRMYMPAWRVTVVLKGSINDQASYVRVTTHVTHATLAQFFPEAEIVDWNPDPWVDGALDEIRGFKSSASQDAGIDPIDDTPL